MAPTARDQLASMAGQLARASESARLSNERHARAMEASDAGYWDWNIRSGEIFHSDRLKQMLGFGPGTTFAGRDDYIARTPFHPEDRQRVADAIAATLAGGADRYEVDFRVNLPGGETRWVRARGKVFRDAAQKAEHMSETLTDVTDERHAQQALRESEARFRSLTELSSDWYWRQDENLRFTYLSSQAIDLTGHSGESSYGKTRWELANMTPLAGAWDDHKAVLAARQPFRDLECSRVGRDGVVRYLSMTGEPLFDEEGRFTGYHGIGSNITERKRIERQLRQAQRLEAMGTLAGGIAHDFNNILGAILGYGEMAQRDAQMGSRLRRDLDSIMTAGERGRALVEQILTFSRSSVSERVAVHLERVVREALDHLQARLPKGVAITSVLRAGPAAVLGDPTQVHQVLMNLATNAVQAMPAGGTVRVQLEPMQLEAARVVTTGTVEAGDYVMLEVVDAGVGIAPDIVDRIFDPFFTTKEVGVGTGLGLSLVHSIVSDLGGAINVASTPGAGSVFTVFLPRAGDAAEVDQHETPEVPRGGRERVLVVDDEEPLMRIATEALEEFGYLPVGFTSSAAALEAFRSDPQGFDAVVTDERMPGMTGTSLIRELRVLQPGVPTLLMSGFIAGTVSSKIRDSGADEVLKKPLSGRELAASLARVLHRARAGSR